MACYIFGAGSFYGLDRCPRADDFIIAADGGWRICRSNNCSLGLLQKNPDIKSVSFLFP